MKYASTESGRRSARFGSPIPAVKPAVRLGGGLACVAVLLLTMTNPWARAASAMSPSVRYTAVSTAADAGAGVCALTTRGKAACWDGEDNTYIGPSGTYTQISVGGTNDNRDTDNFACGLLRDGTVRCWSIQPPFGSNDVGVRMKATPYGPQPSGAFVYVASGPDDACGMRASGRIYCWLDASNMGSANPLPKDRFSSVTLGGESTDYYAEYAGCGVRRNGELACWGKAAGAHGSLPLSVANPPRGRFLEVASPYQGACALRSEGTIACWRFHRTLPAGFSPRYRFAQISDECGLRRSHQLWCQSGGVGKRAWLGHLFRQFSQGGDASCGVQLDGTLYPVSEQVGYRTEPSICQPPQYGP